MEFKIGADPELFVRTDSGLFVSAHEMCEGTKEKPTPVPNGAVQVDGTALEFNIDPAKTLEGFLNNIKSVMSSMNSFIPEGHELVAQPSVEFDPDVWKEIPREAKELGCSPDYNAWIGKKNPSPSDEGSLRVGGGHVHIGWTDDADIQSRDHAELSMKVVRQMDCALGLQSLSWDNDKRRRQMYGQAGAFRPKSYGVEYRSLSNAWLKNESLMTGVYEAAIKGLKDLTQGVVYTDFLHSRFSRFVPDTINNGEEDVAAHMVDALHSEFGLVKVG